LALNCGVPLTAPAGGQLLISADPLSLPVVDGVSTITVRGFKGDSEGGGPLPNGTQIFLTTPVGTIEERVEMREGLARAFLRSNGRAGRAAVVASSGAGVSVTLDPPVIIGNVEGINILLVADPPFASPPNFTSTINATVFDNHNNPLRDVPLIFSTTAGALASGGSIVRTDSLGQARDVLTLRNERSARVTAVSGSVSSNPVTVIREGAPGGPIVASISPSSGSLGQTLTVRVSGANFQNGATVSLGSGITVAVISTTANLMRATVNIAPDASPGSRDVTVTNPDGTTDTLQRGFTVLSLSRS
jgi:hypothetical protein